MVKGRDLVCLCLCCCMWVHVLLCLTRPHACIHSHILYICVWFMCVHCSIVYVCVSVSVCAAVLSLCKVYNLKLRRQDEGMRSSRTVWGSCISGKPVEVAEFVTSPPWGHCQLSKGWGCTLHYLNYYFFPSTLDEFLPVAQVSVAPGRIMADGSSDVP